MNSDGIFLEKINRLISCDPKMCIKGNCPLYFEEYNCCDADRFIDMVSTKFKLKFENVRTYSIYNLPNEESKDE